MVDMSTWQTITLVLRCTAVAIPFVILGVVFYFVKKY
jgi:hypothetical protein